MPSGASTGTREAVELRDGDADRFGGMGVTKAMRNVNETISPAFHMFDAITQEDVDRRLCELDGTKNKSRLGANAILGVSMAVAQASAASAGIPLYRYLGGFNAHLLPVPLFNVLNGGRTPTTASTFKNSWLRRSRPPAFAKCCGWAWKSIMGCEAC